MKKLFTLLLFFICIKSFGQFIDLTAEEKAKIAANKEAYAIWKTPGNYRPGTEFVKDQKNYSNDKRYFFQFQSDGNLVVYKVMGPNSVKALWHTHTNGKAIKKCVFQGDGNLVLYDYNNKAIWDAFTDQYHKDKANKSILGNGDRFTPVLVLGVRVLIMQGDGNLVIYDVKKGPSWASDTFEKN